MAGKKRRESVEKATPLFTVVINSRLKDIVEKIRSGSCPYCGARIRMKGYLAMHVKVVHHEAYYSDIRRAVDAYMKLVSLMVHSGNGWVIKENGVVLKGYKTDIARRIAEDPSILRRLGVI
jgi:DNA-directed RNA polymerase subunit RPC12/RpoP